MIEIEIAQEKFILLPEKALWRKTTNDLIIADVHLGKGTHFNKAGMPIPSASGDQDIKNLEALIDKYKPKSVVFLGDLFHSSVNSEWDFFVSFLNRNKTIKFILVKGNHDIIPDQYYLHDNFETVESLTYNNFVLCHEPIEQDRFVICGHLHPGFKMKAKAKQSITLPCFYKTYSHLIVPAFGALTGLYTLEKKKSEKIWVIAGNKVLLV